MKAKINGRSIFSLRFIRAPEKDILIEDNPDMPVSANKNSLPDKSLQFS